MTMRREVYKLPPEVRARIGAEVLVERAAGVAWKLLERKHRYCRERLRLLAKEACVAHGQQHSGKTATD